VRAEQADQRARDAAHLVLKVQQPLEGARHAAPKPRRDRHGMRVIKGGLAAFAPVGVLLAHGGTGPAVGVAWRWLFRSASDHVRYVVAAVVLGLAGAWTAGAVPMTDGPPAHAYLMPVSHHDAPPAHPLHHHRGAPPRYPVPSGMVRAAHHQDRRADAERVLALRPSPSPSPSNLAPSPSPSVTVSPSPTG
jgi:hypothetical protein